MRPVVVALLVVVVVTAGAGCKDRSARRAPDPAPAAPPPAAKVKVDPNDVASPQSRCLYACLVLRDTAIAEAPAAYAKACGKPWPYAADDCEALAYARACLDASYGRRFERRDWLDRFTHTAWYQPRDDFQPSVLPAVAQGNAHALDVAEATCRKAIPEVTAADRALAKTWFATLMAAHPKTIEGVFTDPANLHAALAGLVLDERAVLRYQAVPVQGRRTLVIEQLHRADGSADRERVLKLSFAGDELTGVNW